MDMFYSEDYKGEKSPQKLGMSKIQIEVSDLMRKESILKQLKNHEVLLSRKFRQTN